MMENHEEDIEEWFWNHQGEVPLQQYLCKDRVLASNDQKCLAETLKGEVGQRPPAAATKKDELWE